VSIVVLVGVLVSSALTQAAKHSPTNTIKKTENRIFIHYLLF
jgi:hypothetical protein